MGSDPEDLFFRGEDVLRIFFRYSLWIFFFHSATGLGFLLTGISPQRGQSRRATLNCVPHNRHTRLPRWGEGFEGKG